MLSALGDELSLRAWMGVSHEVFYDAARIAIIPGASTRLPFWCLQCVRGDASYRFQGQRERFGGFSLRETQVSR